MERNFKITNQSLKCTDQIKLVVDSINFVTAVFNFDESWVGLYKTITFINRNTEVFKHVVLGKTETSCLIPWEVLADAGALVVYAEGTSDDGILVVGTTNMQKPVRIVNNDKEEFTTESLTPTPDVYTQIIERLSALEDIVNNL